PVGVGFEKKKADLEGRMAPQIEHPLRPHTKASDRHPPMGYGAIMTDWLPRRAYAGTFDDVWRATRMPLMPVDFDTRFHNVAHPPLLFAGPLAAGTGIGVAGMSLAPLAYSLPAWPVVVRARSDASGKRVVPIAVDTMVIHPGLARFEISARCTLPIGRG